MIREFPGAHRSYEGPRNPKDFSQQSNGKAVAWPWEKQLRYSISPHESFAKCSVKCVACRMQCEERSEKCEVRSGDWNLIWSNSGLSIIMNSVPDLPVGTIVNSTSGRRRWKLCKYRRNFLPFSYVFICFCFFRPVSMPANITSCWTYNMYVPFLLTFPFAPVEPGSCRPWSRSRLCSGSTPTT
jgi:hypothetical protein